MHTTRSTNRHNDSVPPPPRTLQCVSQIDTGVDTVDWKEVAVKSHLDDLHVKVRELKAKMNEIIQDQVLSFVNMH